MRVIALSVVILALFGGRAGADEVGISDFARSMPLSLSGEGALYELPLPVEAYAGTVRRDLGDVAVFNGQGEIVPFTLVRDAAEGRIETGRELPLFPLPAERSHQVGADIQVRTDSGGAIVNVSTRKGMREDDTVNAYIVDASALDRTVTGFELGMVQGQRNYIGTVRVQTSDNLYSWREHSSAAVATLSGPNRQLIRDRISFPPVKARYYRLILCPLQNAPRISSVTPRHETADARRHETARLNVAAVKGKRGEYLAQTGGNLPVDTLRLVMPEENGIAQATFLSRPDQRSPWVERGSGTFYRLRRGADTLESTPLETCPIYDRYWLIRIAEAGGVGADSVPQLEVGWHPHRLLFAARGNPPFRLAFGSGRTGSLNFRDENIATGLSMWEKKQVRPLPAVAGASVESGGKQALRQRIPEAAWRKAVLWGALILGVLILGRMAWTLLREMTHEKEKVPPKNHDDMVEGTKGGGE